VAATVFVDRDGVINVNRADHVRSWEDFEFLPGALEGLALLTRHRYRVIVVTNQAVINRGLVERSTLEAIHRRMLVAVKRAGGEVVDIMICPHRPEEGCACRKPEPGLLRAAEQRYSVEMQDAVLVGDHVGDLLAAHRAGCDSILVLSGRTLPSDAVELPSSCLSVLPDLRAAAAAIVMSPGLAALKQRAPRPTDNAGRPPRIPQTASPPMAR
jgi:D-glycero-D-manno-heptose 1,7-bisphosphate phosphatase